MARIIYIPGKNPKPAADLHRQQLWRCLLNGVQRVNAATAASLAEQPEAFDLLAWNREFYGEETSLESDLPWIDQLLEKSGPTREDIREARHWKKRLTKLGYAIGDRFPSLIRWLGSDATRSTIRETRRYFANMDGAAEIIHRKLMHSLEPSLARGEPVLLIGHSLGSVIAWNALWLLTHREGCRDEVDHLLTLGSPLGVHFVQRRLLGHDREGTARYPACIDYWTNIAAVGDLTALDPTMKDDFHDMVALKLVKDIHEPPGRIYNFYRDDNGINPHKSYGYLANPVVGEVIAGWWNRHGMSSS